MQNRPFSPEVIFSSIPALLPYLLVTLEVGLISILTGSILGMLLAWAKLSSHKMLRCAADGYTYVIRCTPSIVLLFIVFYGLPKWMEFAFAIDIDDLSRAVFVIITFTMLFGAYVSEVFRSAYLAVPKGQYEAAVTIGLSPLSAFIQILDRIRILTADRHADHAGTDVILRENVFLFAGRRLPYPLRPDIIFA